MLFGAKFKPSMLDKWRAKPPKISKLQKMRSTMSAEERQLVNALAWEQGWPASWLALLPDTAAAELLAECYPAGEPDRQKELLGKAVALLKQPEPRRNAAKNLLLALADERLVSLLLAAAFSPAEARAQSFPAELLCQLLTPWREQTGRALLLTLPDLSADGKLLAVRLCGLLKPGNAAEILHCALTGQPEELRVLAAKTAGILSAEGLLDFLTPALADEAAAVRAAACETLGLYAGVPAIPTLRQMQEQDEAWTVKSMCSSFISKWENKLAEQIRLDEGELFLRDSKEPPYAKN